MEFLSDEKVVATLQHELPLIIKEIRQGKKLAVIVEILLKEHPSMSSHPFVAFIRPFLANAERFMNFQFDALISVYALFASTPFVSNVPLSIPKEEKGKPVGKTPVAENKPAKEPEVPEKELKVPAKAVEEQPKKKSYKAALKQKEAPFEYTSALQKFEGMGFKNLESVKKLLIKKKGNVQAVLDELFRA